MNILFFLKPKSEITYIYSNDTLMEVIEKIEPQKYSAIPIINKKGEYVGTITEGDILWSVKDSYFKKGNISKSTIIMDIPRRRDNMPVTIDSNIEDLISKAMDQNFVPVIDDKNIFIGIVTRKDIIQYCYNKTKEQE
ncbi:CBS domain-containing protein [Anaeromicropila herbilytica]|uniref:CBS domain-containing protein n=1 Tax=Anaeromicropila herbilytica TaxID=2785025 RepID=A0A7R7EKC9_9FIRM|nr:CBS domain-containing protein [Anaeromicropila herbilytica]BCN30290.1 CBS domain-containing protein [Anaeromicropila herbilytica]